MNDKKMCKFCGREAVKYYNCWICDSCNIVLCFSLNNEDMIKEVQKCIDSIEQNIINNKEALSDIFIKKANKKTLTYEEEQKIDFCSRFNSIKTELKIIVTDNGYFANSKKGRMLLYELLKLSNEFHEVFHAECYELNLL